MPSGCLALEDALDRRDGERLEVDDVGHARVGHDRGRVAVEQDRAHAFVAQRAAGLRAGVVELGRLADDHRPAADDQHRLRLGAFAHSRAMKRSKTSSASSGPGDPSGWYWTVSIGLVSVAQALDRAVVEVALADDEAGLARQRLADDLDLVVLCGDLDAAGVEVLDRVVGAVVAEAQAARVGARGARHDLVAQADAQQRPPVGDRRLREAHRTVEPRRITRPGREHQAGARRVPGPVARRRCAAARAPARRARRAGGRCFP